jgi:hypothetical protein
MLRPWTLFPAQHHRKGRPYDHLLSTLGLEEHLLRVRNSCVGMVGLLIVAQLCNGLTIDDRHLGPKLATHE